MVVGYPQTMLNIRHRSRTLLGTATAAAVLILPSTASADCASTIARSAFRGGVAEWYPQACYTAALAKLGPDVYTYSPNVAYNIKSAMRRDRTRKVKLTITFLKRRKVRITSSVKLKSGVQLLKGSKVVATGSFTSTTTVLRTKATGNLTAALTWRLGKRTIVVTH